MTSQLPVRHYQRFPFDAPKGHVESVLELPTDRTAFILVDVFGLGHDSAEELGGIGLFSAESHRFQTKIMHECIRPALDSARQAGLPIIYVENNWQKGVWTGSEFANLVDRVESGHLGAFDDIQLASGYADYSDVLAPLDGDIRVPKTMYDGFFETTLDSVLRNLGVQNIVAVGFSAEICLLQTVIGAMYRNYRVVVLRDCVLGSEFVDTMDELVMTNWAIRYYESMVGYTSTAAQFIEAHQSGNGTAS